jgi:glycosyltransferase involved in cell wall biosynthesis
MKIWAYVTIWNEELMLEYYLRYYSKFCDRIVFFDNESTDNSKEIIKSYPNTEIRTFSTGGVLNDATHIKLKSEAIKEAKGNCDYVIISDCDEFIYHPNLINFLQEHLNKTSIFYPAGFQMVSEEFYINKNQIYDNFKIGTPDPWYSKPILLNPNMVKDFNWVEGCHEIDKRTSLYKGGIYHPLKNDIHGPSSTGNPWGAFERLFKNLEVFESEPLKLLHYKYLGRDYVHQRYIQYINRIGKDNSTNDLGSHYTRSIENNTISLEINKLLKTSIKLNLK